MGDCIARHLGFAPHDLQLHGVRPDKLTVDDSANVGRPHILPAALIERGMAFIGLDCPKRVTASAAMKKPASR